VNVVPNALPTILKIRRIQAIRRV